MEVLRSEVLKTVKKRDPLYPILDDLSYRAKNVYNSALYLQKESYSNTEYLYNSFELYKIYKENYGNHGLLARTVSLIVKEVATTTSNYIRAYKEYKWNPKKFNGEPKFPRFKDYLNGGYTVIFDYQQVRFRDGKLHFPEKTGIAPLKTRLDLSIPDGFFSENEMNPIREVRIIPQLDSYKIELVYKKNIEESDTNNYKTAAAIDLGIDNFATVVTYGANHARPLIITGKGIKSYNKNFNKRLAKAKSDAIKCNGQHTTKRVKQLYNKRDRVYKDFYHKASKAIVDYLKENEVHTLFIGYNKGWKNESQLSKQVNQTFIQIGHYEFVQILTYKAEEAGITVKMVSEEYTSGTSFLDGEEPTQENYNKNRRVHRGLFISNNGIEINADVNAAYQILSKGSDYRWKFNTVNLGKESLIPIRVNIDTF